MPLAASPPSDPPETTLAALERELEATVIQYDLAEQAYNRANRGVAGCENFKAIEAAATRIDELHEEIARAPAETLGDVAVKLRRVDVALDDEHWRVRRLLRTALLAVEAAARQAGA